jgi:hypothetical protein
VFLDNNRGDNIASFHAITVRLDGGYIRGRERRPGGTGCVEVIAGKSIPEEGRAKVFAGVGQIDTKPKRRDYTRF